MNMNNHKLTDEQFDKLLDENTSVKEMKELKALANERFNYIIKKLAEIVGRDVHWFDFSNEGGEKARGYFDPASYIENIDYIGQIEPTRNQDFINYDDCFPTVWLKTDFEPGLINEVAQFVEKEKKLQEDEKQKKDEVVTKINDMHKAILEKLTDEEKNYISFKPFKQVYEESKARAKSKKNKK